MLNAINNDEVGKDCSVISVISIRIVTLVVVFHMRLVINKSHLIATLVVE